ncbi:MAG: signal peptidase I [Candidatus Aureabacteria bacterium]|nr:signal peptidase I [Candidatus Auribacterota bacterium]
MSFWSDRRTVKNAKIILATTRKLYRKHRRKLPERDALLLDQEMADLKGALRARAIPEIDRAADRLYRSMDRCLGFAKKSIVREYAEAFIFALILAIFLRTFVIQLFKIPTGSMEPTLWGAANHGGFGDHIVVNKFIYGPETLDWIGIPWTNTGFELPTWRFEKLSLRKPVRGDIIVFKFPFNYHCNNCPQSLSESDFVLTHGQPRACPRCGSRSIEYQNKDFVKRCIGLPGETVEIRDGHIYINDELVTDPRIFNIHYVNIPPERGLYGHPGQKFRVPADSYLALGDNSMNSKDSRVWGFVPFEDIRGKAVFIYLPVKRIGVIR